MLSASAAMAQADKAPTVTKLPGEEKLSIRERAERDFLMPTRHKKMAEVAKATATEEDATAAPELDATAHYTETAAELRPEDVAVATHTEHHTAVRHYSRSHHSTRHYSASSRSSKTKHHTAEKTSAHRSHKAKTKAKKSTAVRHTVTRKKTTKAKAHSRRHRR